MIHNILNEMIFYNQKDALRINHALKVYSFAECIIKNETTDNDIIEIL